MTNFDRQEELRTKICFQLDQNEWHGYATESVWAQHVAGNRFRLLNTPFFAKGVSYLDVVIARDRGRKTYLSVGVLSIVSFHL
jgi:hypothetical protein